MLSRNISKNFAFAFLTTTSLLLSQPLFAGGGTHMDKEWHSLVGRKAPPQELRNFCTQRISKIQSKLATLPADADKSKLTARHAKWTERLKSIKDEEPAAPSIPATSIVTASLPAASTPDKPEVTEFKRNTTPMTDKAASPTPAKDKEPVPASKPATAPAKAATPPAPAKTTAPAKAANPAPATKPEKTVGEKVGKEIGKGIDKAAKEVRKGGKKLGKGLRRFAKHLETGKF